ncbi:PemK family transcriptional regulator [Candidatus Nomurabacteria bacterium RIFCSPHIGHO2_02_FULL_41_18]|uniref:mRNA interferase n=1 Tax=Candidatus Nomurabacteria bacterium RIFCSPHIGHO2_02_FULL_41_18 TaxID=1801754 RepID=A0A1F6W6X2_9BACT|nr:MAG: PemK family transcriptional regulator [Candidatus Nomurabacteria bacterium RIFCSPHIGHO2_01_FULL_41_71]OGI77594.1 MAG: PemK family transcriptional regulator [Candidatus Nomurabacteria bacterium RIFCSPHIGHO2_02_FULL_41_18]OGI89094.1 MAG: PemK family transcriptional regulator [Candidatus Nomurabacteria bacterium RIFCSPLOWO2_01_FULL_41_52b]OGJ00388.1 MAG: PemK family transcriptional regulator [Candidatus Nomurabacteria bacterium RIFCSPLOWO2_02_FULL_41_9]
METKRKNFYTKSYPYPRRGEIHLVNFDPTIGSEIKKTRPAVIIQNDVSNEHSQVTIVAAITSQINLPLYPNEILIKSPEGGLEKDSATLLNQIRSIDRKRLIKKMGAVSPATLEKIENALKISLGMVKF